MRNTYTRIIGLLCFFVFTVSANPGILGDYPVIRGERPPVDIDNITREAYEPGKLLVKFKPEFEELIPDKVIKASKGDIVRTGVAVIDKLNSQFGASSYRPLMQGLYDHDSKSLQKRENHKAWGFHLWFEVELDSKSDVVEAVKGFSRLEEVETAEPVYRKRIIAPVPVPDTYLSPDQTKPGFPDDPRYEEQWHYNNTGQTVGGQTGIAGIDISLEAAWQVEKGRPDVIVAIFDDGMDFAHEDLAANVWEDIGPEGENTQAFDHATHVAGTVAAVTNNSKGVAGIAGGTGEGDGVRLMTLDILEGEHEWTDLALYTYAADNGAAISQNSWGYTQSGVYNQSALDGIDYFNTYGGGEALIGGGITIFAAGNDDDDGKWYPAYYEGAMAVASYDNRGIRSGFSNYGEWIDISAPGTGILSTLKGNSYGIMQGTSMACPHVSGVAALVVSNAYGVLSPQNLWDILVNNVDEIYQYNDEQYQGKLGSGGVNAYEALMAAQAFLGRVAGVQAFSAAPDGHSHIDLSWSKNEDNDDVMITWSQDGTFGTPVEGYEYSIGEAIDGGGTVLYRGGDLSSSHSGLNPDTRYYYRAFSYDTDNNYSLGRDATAVTDRQEHLVTFNVQDTDENPLENAMIIVAPGGNSDKGVFVKAAGEQGDDAIMISRDVTVQGRDAEIKIDHFEPAKSYLDEDGTWIHWDDGVYAGAIGIDANVIFSVASRWESADIAEFDGQFIRKLKFFIGDIPTSTTAKIWQGPDEAGLVEVYSQEFTPVELSWVEVNLAEPYKIDVSKELWFGYEIEDPGAGVFPAGRDQTTDHDGKGNKLKRGQMDWENLTDVGLSGDWLIRAFLIEPDTLYTDASGSVSIEKYSGIYYYTVGKDSYTDIEGNFTVDDEPLQVNITLVSSDVGLPVVTTSAISDITSTTATGGGEVTGDGGADVTARGVVRSTLQNPTLEENDGFTEDGTGTGEFVSELTGLEPGTTYYVRAYATNSEGTAYGDEVVFSTLAPLDPEAPDGSGTEEDPYRVETLDHLLWIYENPGEWDKHYRQVADIDASDTESWNDGQGWQSIGFSTSTGTTPWDPCHPDESFTGTYDGNNKVIEGLYINRPGVHYQGFFGCLLDATVSDLGLTNVNFTGDHCLGGLAGQIDGSYIYGSFTTGSVSGDYQVGGLIGRSSDENDVAGCYSTASVSGGNNVGGLVGTHSGNSLISNSYSRGSVNGSSFVGGLVGILAGAGPVVDRSYSTGAVTATGSSVGGLVGRNDNIVTNSYWDTETSGRTNSAGGTGLTTEQMTYPYEEGAYEEWDFDLIWNHDEDRSVNDGYPYLLNDTTEPPDVSLPSVTTSAVTGITTTTATGGGEVTGDGGAEVTARGIVWSTVQDPTLENNDGFTEDGTGTGEFTSELTGLEPGTTYYVRAYATNSEGTTYGGEKEFTSSYLILWNKLASIEEVENSETGPGGTIVGDVNFNNYVRYGKGLTPNTGRAESGVDFPTTVVDPERGAIEMWVRFYYTPVAYSYGVYGLVNVHHWTHNVMLFSWHNEGSLLDFDLTFNGISRRVNLNDFSPPLDTPVHLACIWDRQGIDDTGDFMQIYVNGSLVASNSTHNDWGTDNTSGNFRVAAPWDSDFDTDRYSIENIKVWTYAKTDFDAVSDIVLPVVISSPVTGITTTTATGGGEVTGDGGAEVTARGIVWSTVQDPTLENNDGFTEDGTGTGEFTSELTGLEPGTTYYVKAYATNSKGTAYGQEVDFTTEAVYSYAVTFNVFDEDTAPVANAKITIMPKETDDQGKTVILSGEQNDDQLIVQGHQFNGMEISGRKSSSPIRYESPVEMSGEWFHWDSGENHGTIGLTSSGTFSIASRWETEDLTGYDGMHISLISFFPASDNCDYTLKLWDDAGNELYSQDVNEFTAGTWNIVSLDTPFMIDASKELWFGFDLDQRGDYPAGRDQGPAIAGKGDLLNGGDGWFSMSEGMGYDQNWNLQAYAVDIITLYTDADGKAGFEAVSGTYSYIVEKEGYNNVSDDFIVEESGLNIDVQLEPEITLPSVTTSAVTGITTTTGTGGGEVTDDGGADVTSRGVVWSTLQNPTLEENDGFTEDGTGTGEFTSELTGLEPGTTYYVRAYATNSQGTAYGDQVSFTTLEEDSSIIPGDGVTDIDGNFYNTVTIGDQEWMAKNLRVTRYNNSDAIPTGLNDTEWIEADADEEGAYTIFPHEESGDGLNSDAEVVEAYGKLYNWYAVDDERGLCPAGWRVPTYDDWTELVDYVVDQGYPNEPDYQDGAGNALKSCRQFNSPLGGNCETSEHPRWGPDFTHYGFDEFGFSALPGGQRESGGSFYNIDYSGYWWSSTKHDTHQRAWYRRMNPYMGDIQQGLDNKRSGYSVRCILGVKPIITLPTVTTAEASEIIQNQAVSGGAVTDDGGAEVTARGVVWGTEQDPELENYDGFTEDGTGTGEFVTELTGLEPETTYYVKAYATNSEGTAYGQEVYFTTEPVTFIMNEPVASVLTVFPNPASDHIIVESERLIHKMRLIDISGQIIMLVDVNGYTGMFEVSSLPSGIYLIKVETEPDGEVVTKRIAISR